MPPLFVRLVAAAVIATFAPRWPAAMVVAAVVGSPDVWPWTLVILLAAVRLQAQPRASHTWPWCQAMELMASSRANPRSRRVSSSGAPGVPAMDARPGDAGATRSRSRMIANSTTHELM